MKKHSFKKGFASLFKKGKDESDTKDEERLKEEKLEEEKLEQNEAEEQKEPAPRQTETHAEVKVNLDGSCKLKINTEGVFLKIIQPLGQGKPVDRAAIEKETKKKEIIDIDWEEIELASEEGREGWFLIAPRLKELDRDSSITIQLVGIGMLAYLDYQPPLGGRHLSVAEFNDILSKEGIVYGIDQEVLTTIEKSDWPMQRLKIAEGTQPQPGKDGEIKYYIATPDEAQPGKVRDDGSIDFYDLNLIQNVKEGAVLAALIPPEPGIPGFKVTGEEIQPAKPKEAKLPAGKNTKLNAEGDKLLAAIDGQALFEGARLSVLPIFQHKGDVDLSTGHIDFLGSIVIDGNVAEGLHVKAGGDVRINGHLDAATVISEGNVVITKGFRGKNKGLVEAKGDLTVKFVENGIINVRGDLLVGEAIMHSQVQVGGKVLVEGKGLIVGGHVYAGANVDAKTIGSNLATKTEVKVGVDPLLLAEEEEKLNKQKEVADNLQKIRKVVAILGEQEALGRLAADKLEQLHKYRETEQQLLEEESKLSEDLHKIKEGIEGMRQGTIVARQRLYPGVRIGIANSNYLVKDEHGRSRLIYVDGEIVFSVL